MRELTNYMRTCVAGGKRFHINEAITTPLLCMSRLATLREIKNKDSLFFILRAWYELDAFSFVKIGFDPTPWRMLKETGRTEFIDFPFKTNAWPSS